jgi:pimeloyl-ACP methyl ester carboxylesterase
METKSILIKDSTVSYIDMGKGETMVLLHGFCGSKSYWEKIIPSLSENYRVIAPDLPGHGDSANLRDNYTIEDIADHMKDFIDQLNLLQVTMFGHSLGGYITLAFAEKYSDRLNGFSLVHSTAFPDSDEAKKGREAGIEIVKQEGIQVFIDGLVPKLFSPANLETHAEDVDTTKEIGYSTLPQGAMSTLMAMKNRPDRNPVLKETSLPVLLLAGEEDQIIPAEKTFSVSKSTIKQVMIKNSGHMSMYENPNKLLSVIKDFMSKLS